MKLERWCVESGNDLDYAYLVWLSTDGLRETDGNYELNFTHGYIDLKSGRFVPQGEPKWKSVDRDLVYKITKEKQKHS